MRSKHVAVVMTIFFIAAAVFLIYSVNRAGQDMKQQAEQSQTKSNNTSVPNTQSPTNGPVPGPPPTQASALAAPMDRAKERVTKKPFGVYITPKTSPVQPERFTGYHTGVDFEIFSEEVDTDVAIKAVCTGKLLQKRAASGYGGVAMQSCILNDQPVTIIYGHLRLSSVGADVGATLKAGDQLGVLGAGYSSETSGERKHLHLGIHKGSAINIAGYVASKSSLTNWLNVLDYL